MGARPKEKKPDAMEDLLDLRNQLKSFAEEAAAAPDASEEHERALAEDVELLCGSDEDVEPPGLPDPGAVMSLIQIIDDYEKLARLTWRRPKAQKIAPIGPFVPNGVVHLQTVLIAALDLGGQLKSPTLRAEIERLKAKAKAQTESATKRKQERAAEVGDLVRQMRAEGNDAKTIQKKLKELGFERKLATIYGYGKSSPCRRR